MTQEQRAEPVNAGTSGAHFCEWCLDNWSLYEKMGGACTLLSIAPIHLRPDGPVEVAAAMPLDLCNALGSVHGGALSMLLDEVGGLAVCCSLGFRYLRGTRDLHVTFLKRAKVGPVVARATVSRPEPTAAIVEAEITQGDLTIATARGSYAVYAPGEAKLPGHDRVRA